PRTAKQNIVYDDTMVIKWELAEQDNMWTIRVEVPSLDMLKMSHRDLIKQEVVREGISEILTEEYE
ncbi:hypothetical protein COV27_02085, partial [candidate division WWE3 bacterium CG10_big_fil_rev_8_21_14_0_10_39_14]